MKDTQNFTAQRLPNGVTEITDLSGVHCFLVEGRDKALLIDTMTGLRGLPAFVATLTDLPVEVALTHGHMDHAGGVFEFGRCYIHPADIPMLDGRTLPARVGYVRGQLPPGEAPEASAFVPDGPVEFVPLKAGDKLDLGGRVLEVLHVPGHTRGSLCYLDTASGDFFAGDACNNNTLLMMDVSATIEEYLEALLALKERQGARGFCSRAQPPEQTPSAITSVLPRHLAAPTTASRGLFGPPRLSGQGANPRHLQPQGRPVWERRLQPPAGAQGLRCLP
ncbi:MAG: MBL fold metallo-hydrolase [Acutalibacter sp.]